MVYYLTNEGDCLKILFDNLKSGETLYAKMVTPICEKHNLTYMEFTILMFLTNNPKYDTATQIIKHRHLTKSHVSITIRSLERRGFITCEYINNDRRTVHLKLTDKVADIVVDGHTAQKEFFEIFFDGFDEDEIKILNDYMVRIAKNINNQITK